MVKQIARSMVAHTPASVELDDLIQAGSIGLLRALERFEPDKGVPLRAFVRPCIKGAVLDYLRETDWAPRSVRRFAKQLASAQAQLCTRLQRSPTRVELAVLMHRSVQDVDEMVRSSEAREPRSLDAPCANDRGPPLLELLVSPNCCESDAEASQQREILNLEVARLPANERHAVERYFRDDLGVKEIALELGVSESRVSQLHHAGTERIAQRLKRLIGSSFSPSF
jgi:RNA polymerase sigma factor for flagellar operon FliA